MLWSTCLKLILLPVRGGCVIVVLSLWSTTVLEPASCIYERRLWSLVLTCYEEIAAVVIFACSLNSPFSRFCLLLRSCLSFRLLKHSLNFILLFLLWLETIDLLWCYYGIVPPKSIRCSSTRSALIPYLLEPRAVATSVLVASKALGKAWFKSTSFSFLLWEDSGMDVVGPSLGYSLWS